MRRRRFSSSLALQKRSGQEEIQLLQLGKPRKTFIKIRKIFIIRAAKNVKSWTREIHSTRGGGKQEKVERAEYRRGGGEGALTLLRRRGKEILELSVGNLGLVCWPH